MNILITGGAGYIGSHITTLSSIRNKVTIIDNFSNSRKNIINNFKKLNLRNIKIIKADIRDTKLLIKIIKKYNIETVIHLAALKSVKESFKKTKIYFDNNINGSISIAKAMQETGCKKLVFSSTASVYGNPKYFPIDERHPISKKLNPYANSKYQIEKYLYNLSKNDNSLKIIVFRYFNVAGAHPSRIIGENPINNIDNLFPSIFKSLKSKPLKIFGNNYLTRDGTAIRDYVHVMDIAKAHLKAINFLEKNKGFYVFNLGTNKGSSVLSIINIFQKILKKNIPYLVYSKRIGDPDKSVASYKRANKFLKWKPNYSILQICRSSINYYKNFINKK
jgi:UDP-glucose 4-epimerase